MPPRSRSAPSRAVLAALATLTLTVAPTTAQAVVGTPDPVRLVSTGLSTGGGTTDAAQLVGHSSDGARAYFETAQAIPGTGDTDAHLDVYERRPDGTLRLVSAGTNGAAARFVAATDDGSRVMFATTAAIAGLGDANATHDVYEQHVGGAVRLISGGRTGAASVYTARYSEDGSTAFFVTNAALVAEDVNPYDDLYARAGDGTVTLLSSGDGISSPALCAASPSGARVVFTTSDALTPDDGDTAIDVYERAPNGTYRKLSAGDGPNHAACLGASRDLSRVVFSTTERLTALGDQDNAQDLFERTANDDLRMLSTNGGEHHAHFAGLSRDGTRVLFRTDEPISGAGDHDASQDLFVREADGSVTLVSPGSGGAAASFDGATPDLDRIYYRTAAAVPGSGDNGSGQDVFEWRAGQPPRLVTEGGEHNATVVAVSDDGARVHFTTAAAIPGTGDADAATDVYLRHESGGVWLVSGSATGVAAEVPVTDVAASRDGRHVFFRSAEPFPGAGDINLVEDVYRGGIALAPAPVDPVIPSGPGDPVAPVVPGGPVGPVGPVAPGGPTAPPPGSEGPAAARTPVIRLTAPACTGKRKSAARCRAYRRTAAAYQTLRGTLAHRTSTAQRVQINVVRRVGKRCWALTTRGFRSTSCRKATTYWTTATVDARGRWRLTARGVAAGRHTVRARVSEAGARATSPKLLGRFTVARR